MESNRLEGVSKVNPQKQGYVPSKVHPDTLFNFTSNLSFLVESLENKCLFPRYCIEDTGYLHIKGLRYIAYPMKCFCDINLHQIDEHLDWYGYYGLSFSKSWGVNRGIQPVKYINIESELKKDLAEALRKSIKDDSPNKSKTHLLLQNYLVHELMYTKPYSGWQLYSNGKAKRKNFSDECEWRYVPNIEALHLGFNQILFLNSNKNENLHRISNALKRVENISIPFEYSDIKYIIVKDEPDAKLLIERIESFCISENEKYSLFSKILIWENVKGDF